MAEALDKVTIRPLAVPVLANVTAREANEPDHVRQLLVEQITGRVRWRESMLALKGLGVDTTVEFGGDKVLTGMVKRIEQGLADGHARYARRHRSFWKGALNVRPHRKNALVTGASGGIGGAIAKALHGQGAAVVLSGTRVEALEALKAELGARAFIAQANLSDTASVEALPKAAEEAAGAHDRHPGQQCRHHQATISSCA